MSLSKAQGPLTTTKDRNESIHIYDFKSRYLSHIYKQTNKISPNTIYVTTGNPKRGEVASGIVSDHNQTVVLPKNNNNNNNKTGQMLGETCSFGLSGAGWNFMR